MSQKGTRNVFGETLVKFPNLVKAINLKIQGIQQNPSRLSTKNADKQNVIAETKNKEKILKVREKTPI